MSSAESGQSMENIADSAGERYRALLLKKKRLKQEERDLGNIDMGELAETVEKGMTTEQIKWHKNELKKKPKDLGPEPEGAPESEAAGEEMNRVYKRVREIRNELLSIDDDIEIAKAEAELEKGTGNSARRKEKNAMPAESPGQQEIEDYNERVKNVYDHYGVGSQKVAQDAARVEEVRHDIQNTGEPVDDSWSWVEEDEKKLAKQKMSPAPAKPDFGVDVVEPKSAGATLKIKKAVEKVAGGLKKLKFWGSKKEKVAVDKVNIKKWTVGGKSTGADKENVILPPENKHGPVTRGKVTASGGVIARIRDSLFRF